MFLTQALDLNKIQVLCYVLVLNINIKGQGRTPKCKGGNLKEQIIHHALLCNSSTRTKTVHNILWRTKLSLISFQHISARLDYHQRQHLK